MIWNFLRKLNMELPVESAIPFLNIYSGKTCPHKILSMNIHSCAIRNNPEVQTTQMPISGRMDKQTVVYPCGGILFGHKKEFSANTCYNIGETWKHSSRWACHKRLYLECVCVCVHAQACTQSCPTLCDLIDYNSPGSSVQGIFQARILEWVAISYSRRSSWPTSWIWISCVFCIDWQILYH